MPKRAARRKSMLSDDTTQIAANLDYNEFINESCDQKPAKHMRFIKSNKSNEIKRLLLHNSRYLLHNVDHSDFPAFNVGIWPKENSDLLANYPSYAFSVPRPVFVADKGCEKIDICYRRPMNRFFYNNRLRVARAAYQSALKSNKNIRSSIKDEIYHNSVYDIAERVYMQPDKFFQSSYDYYFTGGNMCVLPYQGRVIHAGGEKLQEMLASEFPEVNEHNYSGSLRKIASLKMIQNSELFELHPLITSLNNIRHNYFIARQRNLVTFNQLSDNNKMKTITQFRTTSTPFISFAQSSHDISNFIITTMKQHIRLYDLNSSVPGLAKLFQISSQESNNSWNTVKPWRENTFLYANEKQFFMIDIRTSPEQWLKEVFLANDSMTCDHISALLPSDFNNLFYVATNHKLQCMDIRHLKKCSLDGSEGGVCRWTHQLRYAPLMMDSTRLHQTEYIALSSPIAGDLHICQLSRERNEDNICLSSSLRMHKHIYSSSCLPYQPPTLLEAYENARLAGKCLRVEANMEARLKCCTTGMKFFNSANNSNCAIGRLLISNSNGDVFAHTLSKRDYRETEKRCNEQSDAIMAEFEQKICNQVTHSLNYTEIKDMKGLRKVFLCKPLSSVKKFCLDVMDNEYNEDATADNNATNPREQTRPKRLHLGRWQKPLSTLYSYKDALVPDLLSIWDIDVEEETNTRLGKLGHIPKTDPAANVENWLKNNINPNPPIVSIPFQEISSYIRNDTSAILDCTFNVSQTQNTIDFENAVHSTQILDNSVNISKSFDTSGIAIQVNNGTTEIVVENLKNKKKNKKYIKGF